MNRTLLLALLSCAAAVGCGPSPKDDPRTIDGSFTAIENAVEDLCASISDATYRTSGDLGTDSDRIGMALTVFLRETADGPLAADAEAIREKINALEKLAATRAPVDRQREAARELQATVAAIKSKL